MDDATLSYIAGFFDAEGSVGVYKRRGYFSLTANLAQQPPCPMLGTIQECFGGSICNGKGGVEIWKIGDNKALAFLEAIQPFLCLPRKVLQVRLAVQFQVRKRGAGCQSGGIPIDELEYRERVYWKLRGLKRVPLGRFYDDKRQFDLNYVAGFFDGDGTIGIYQMGKYYLLKVQIVQKEPCPLLDVLCRQYGGSLHNIRLGIIRWDIGSNQAKEFLKDISAFSRLPQKVSETQLAIQFQSYRQYRAKQFSQSEPLRPNEAQYYESVVAQMKGLKQ